ncbi:class I SAM-dependent methyltransferase [Herbaspirillum rubrisubalbicans]|uniref:class I SAM-dependent methyltransferase n=1 Tax=Herbaspirillum rubrisubalbicans TaxID=80842 RepID=UPI00155869B2|nr:class I SAM-dependent methyltransferase [Herbaspirillum rubrisubalbicans]
MTASSTHHFYRAFEDRYRGSRELIRSRLESYAPFLDPLVTYGQVRPTAFDIGCGRGEWLELLNDHGFAATGVDLDQGMLDACQERGLNAVKGDALEVLTSIPTDSVAVVSAFHVVEHIPFEALQRLMSEALRVLQPGGLLILETPNPDNLVVGASSFYLDPSHERPIPSLLLSFLAEYAGFGRQRIIGLQEEKQLRENVNPSLFEVIHGVSPDYAVVAQKSGPPELMGRLDQAFTLPFGLYLHDLAMRYDRANSQKLSALAAKTRMIRTLESELAQTQQALNSLHTQLMGLEGKLAHLAEPINLRWLRMLKRKGKLLAMHGVLFLEARPFLRRTYRAILRRIRPGMLVRIENYLAVGKAPNPPAVTLSPHAETIAEIVKQHNKFE